MVSGWQGRVIDGRYELEAPLGEGGMGAVFRARHRVTGAEVALKLLHPHVAAIPGVAERFVAEARAPARIGHRGIVQVSDAGETPERELYLVMELLRGETLRELLTRARRLSLEAATSVVVPMLDALGAAHAAGIVHRDLKPENVFLATDEGAPGGATVRLLDFGIAKILDAPAAAGQAHATATGSMMGTVGYMSPEQVRDTAHVDHRADLWAVAVVLFEALTGQAPFQAPSAPEVMVAILSQRSPAASSSVSPCPRGLDELFARAFAPDVEQRFASASEMKAAIVGLGAATAAGSFALGPTSVAPSAPRVSGARDAAASPGAPTGPPQKRMASWILPAAALAGLALVVSVSAVMCSTDASRSPRGAASTSRGPDVRRPPAHGVPAAPADDAVCPRACRDLERCTGAAVPGCAGECQASSRFRACARGRLGDCKGISACALGKDCDAEAAVGRESCQATLACELSCGQRGGDPRPCNCSCIHRIAPEKANLLASQNVCIATQCASECKPPVNLLACGLCASSKCKTPTDACNAR